jgi:hypothetical protein
MRDSLHNFKKENNQICIGWLLQENSNAFINGFSQNIAEYGYVSFDIFGIKQYIGHSVESLQEQSQDYKQMLVIKQGIVFRDLAGFITNVANESNTIIYASDYADDIIDFNTTNADNMSELTDILNLQVSFVANTERFMYKPTPGQKFTKLITSSGGLNPILYPWVLNMTNGATVDVVDLSNIALVNAKRWVNEWDGKDCITFANMLLDSTSVDGLTFITRGGAHKHRMQELVNQQDGFETWFNNTLPYINYNYRKHDFFNNTENDKLVESVKNNVGNVYIHLSNIYHYQPTAFYYNLKSRISMQNSLINKLKAANLGKKVMITYIDAQHRLPPAPIWVDDIETPEILEKYNIFPWQQ